MNKAKMHRINDRPYSINTNEKSNWLRAAALGSNDGIISIAGLVIGVAGATQSKAAILTAGIAGIVAGAISLGAGEYVSVSTQRDMEEALLSKERVDLASHPNEELQNLIQAYEDEGMDPKVARIVANELTKKDAYSTHAEVDLHIDTSHLTNPWSSVFVSAVSFTIGALIPLTIIMIPEQKYTIPITFVSVALALVISGIINARLSGAHIFRSTLRVATGGVLAMVITYAIGNLFNVAVV